MYSANDVEKILKNEGYDVNKRTINYYAFDKKMFEVERGKNCFTEVEIQKIKFIKDLQQYTSYNLEQIKKIINTYDENKIKEIIGTKIDKATIQGYGSTAELIKSSALQNSMYSNQFNPVLDCNYSSYDNNHNVKNNYDFLNRSSATKSSVSSSVSSSISQDIGYLREVNPIMNNSYNNFLNYIFIDKDIMLITKEKTINNDFLVEFNNFMKTIKKNKKYIEDVTKLNSLNRELILNGDEILFLDYLNYSNDIKKILNFINEKIIKNELYIKN